jgi:uncharacterized membrane protein
MAALHPQIVHFTVALVIIGVAFRLVSLLGRPAFVGPAAATLLILAAGSSVLANRSGTAAHGPVERAPGARAAVMEHEAWGERTQTVLLVLGAIELVGLALRRWSKVNLVHALAAVVGLVGVIFVYETAEHGVSWSTRTPVALESGPATRRTWASAPRRLLPSGVGGSKSREGRSGRRATTAASQRFWIGSRSADARGAIAADR